LKQTHFGVFQAEKGTYFYTWFEAMTSQSYFNLGEMKFHVMALSEYIYIYTLRNLFFEDTVFVFLNLLIVVVFSGA